MGAQLVGKAYAFAAQVSLKPGEFRLLAWMSHRALDSDPVPRYFASRESSAFGLGRVIADAPDPLDPSVEAARQAAFYAVKIAIQGLVAKQAIVRLQRGREGTRAQFALTYGGLSLPLKSRESLHLSDSESLPGSVEKPSPLGTSEDNQELGTGEYRVPAFTYLEPVESRSL